jgi:uncharacterized protein YodC (DUF2158 family)
MGELVKRRFKEGDIVKFKSGGPKMVVDKYHKRDVIKCTWFVEGEVRRDYFKERSLVLITQDDIDKEKGMAKAKIVEKKT